MTSAVMMVRGIQGRNADSEFGSLGDTSTVEDSSVVGDLVANLADQG